MEVTIKLPKYELESILEALKTAATIYGSARVTAITAGDSEQYAKYEEKKTMTWQSYRRLHDALERCNDGQEN